MIMQKLLYGIFILMSFVMISCGSGATSDNNYDTVVTDDDLTPGQRLDTAISDTRSATDKAGDKMETAASEVKEDVKTAAEKTKEGLSNAYDKTKEGVKEAGRDIKEAAHDAKEKIGEQSKEIKEDRRK